MEKTIVLSNEKSLEVDFCDLDFRKDYDEKAKAYAEKMKEINLEEEDNKVLNIQYEYTRDFIDSVFGEGTLLEMLGGKKRLDLMLEFIVALTNHRTKTDKGLNAYSASIKF